MNELPSSPVGVLSLLANTRTQIDYFSDSVISEVKQGNESAIKILVQLRAMEMASKRIIKEITDNFLTEADKYPGTKFEFQGNEISKGDVYTEYDYSVCGDTVFERLEVDFETAKSKLDERKTFLKTIKEPIVLVDELTGEVIKINPPQKKSIPGLKVSIR